VVAEELFVSPTTIEFHRGLVYRKLNVRSRIDLVALEGVVVGAVAADVDHPVDRRAPAERALSRAASTHPALPAPTIT
jgi:hypothetical protein